MKANDFEGRRNISGERVRMRRLRLRLSQAALAAKVQTEGGIGQGIGMALYENIQYNEKGGMINNSFMQYKIPTRLDVGKIRVEFENSYEPTGPFGAKSIGEIVINTPSPALANAIYNATGVRLRELPMTSEKILKGMMENGRAQIG